MTVGVGLVCVGWPPVDAGSGCIGGRSVIIGVAVLAGRGGGKGMTGFRAKRIKPAPKTNEVRRITGLETVVETPTLKILNPPPNNEINIKTAPKAKKPIVRFSGMLFSRIYTFLLLL